MKGLFAAIDIGASSGRIIAGELTAQGLTLREIHRFANAPVMGADSLRWDFESLLQQIDLGLTKLSSLARKLGQNVQSIGIDTWAVDYGLLRDGRLLAPPNCYRDPLNNLGVTAVHREVEFEKLYAITGLQFLPFNSLYQLARQRELEEELLSKADYAVMLPDLIGYFLTGVLKTERTNASSTGLLNARTHEWETELFSTLGLNPDLFPPLADAGDELGSLSRDYGPALSSTKVVLVGSHDTASAVVGVPSLKEGFAFLSSGTWSLLGAEIAEPILTAESRAANFTNELGVDNRVRYLKNLSGLWLLSESIRDFEQGGEKVDLGRLVSKASRLNPEQRIDVSDPALVAPFHMASRIRHQLEDSGQSGFESLEELTAIILHSLAESYAACLDQLTQITGCDFPAIHVIGGGSQNSMLCQLTANATGRTILAGPVEATAIGNILVQARTAGLVGPDLEDLRSIILKSDFGVVEYLPQT